MISDSAKLLTDYWNLGDGDMSPAIQRAILDAHPGQDIIVPYSKTPYPVASTFRFNGMNGVTLRGSGRQYYAPAFQWVGPVGGLMCEMNGAQYCTLENLKLDGGKTAAHLVRHWWDGTGQSSYSCVFTGLYLGDFTGVGLTVGDDNNLQTSEATLNGVSTNGGITGIALRGANTNNIHMVDTKLVQATGNALVICHADVLADNTLWLQNAVDLYIDGPERPCIFHKGDSEGSQKFLNIAAFGYNASISFIGVDLNAPSSTAPNVFAEDSSLANVVWQQCGFKYGAKVRMNGFSPMPTSSIKSIKQFQSCRVTDARMNSVALSQALSYPEIPLTDYHFTIQVDGGLLAA